MRQPTSVRAELQCAASAVIESLEKRVLLAVGMGDAKHGPLSKLGELGPIRQEYLNYVVAHGSGTGFVPAEQGLVLTTDGLAIETYVTSDYSPKTLQTKLNSRQMLGGNRYANGVSGIVPFGELSSIALLSELEFARPVWVQTNTGSVTSQGDSAMRADVARSTYPYTGAGVTVGLLSDSFDTSTMWSDHYANDVASGDLPAGIQVLSDYTPTLPADPPSTDEGRAMAQLVYDSAPGATLKFATAYGGQSAFANNIIALKNAGAKVIADDVSYYSEPMFEDGVIAQAVDTVTAAGVSYFSAAGNEARQGYDAPFRPGINRATNSIGGGFIGGLTDDFDPGPGVDDMQQFTLPAHGIVTLAVQWDQPYASIPGSAGSASDVDVYILNQSGTSVVASSVANNIGGDPSEVVQYQNPTGGTQTLQLMIELYSGVQPGELKYVEFNGQATFTQFTTSSGVIYGHANAAGAAAVAAAPWYATPAFGVNPPQVESFSSRGGTNILFDATGTRLGSPSVRQKPNFTAPDGGNTTFFYSDSAADADTLPNFFGTSAAAPAAASVAALLLQANPTLSPAQVDNALASTALDMDDPFTGGFDVGFDNATGAGLIRADQALASVITTISGQTFEDRNDNGLIDGSDVTLNGVTVYLDTNNNGVLDGGESSVVTSGSGNYSFAGLSAGTYHVREVVPTGDVATVPTGALANLTIVGGTITTQNFGDFPIVYTGDGNANNYTVRVDAAQPSFLDIVLGATTWSAAASIIPSLTFNTLGGNDTLTVDYTNGVPIPAGGIFYDGGAATDALIITGSSGNDTVTLANTFGGGPYGANIYLNDPATGNESVENVTFSGNVGNDSLTIGSTVPAVSLVYNGGLTATDQDSLTINGGAYAFNSDFGATTANLALTVNGATTGVTLGSSQHLSSLAINNSNVVVATNGSNVINTNTLAFSVDGSGAATGRLDLRDNDMVVRSGVVGTWNGTKYTGITGLVQQGRNGGAWSGLGVVTSMTAATAIRGKTTLGVATASSALGIASAATASWGTETVTGSSVLVKYTYIADANLNGFVNGDDYFKIDNGFPLHSTGFVNGDFDYNGVINADDYFLIDQTYVSQGGVL